MRIIGLEEHYATDAVREAWAWLPPHDRDDSVDLFRGSDVDWKLGDLSDDRIRQMDECGLDVQVLSLTTPGVQNLDAVAAIPLARQANDLVAEAVRTHPDRFQAFATLPTSAPQEAARELRRAVSELGLRGALVHGRTRDRNMDHPDLFPIYEAAASLRVPLYIHPQIPSRAVRESYYSGFGERLDLHLATGGLGWHLETGIQFVRLILAGVFDRWPDLQIIVGHWGEAVLFYLERVDLLSKAARHLNRPVTDYFLRHISVTPSGMLSQRYLSWAIALLGVDRILFSTDYPYQFAPAAGARRFLEESALSQDDKEKIASANWERLCQRGSIASQEAS